MIWVCQGHDRRGVSGACQGYVSPPVDGNDVGHTCASHSLAEHTGGKGVTHVVAQARGHSQSVSGQGEAWGVRGKGGVRGGERGVEGVRGWRRGRVKPGGVGGEGVGGVGGG